MTGIVTNVAHLPERHRQELLRGERVRAELDVLQQRRLKEASNLLETRHIEGLGQKVLCIAPGMAARLRVIYGMSCLHDPDFRKALLRDNPVFRINCKARNVSVRVDGFRKPDTGLRIERRAAGDHVARGEPAKPLPGDTNAAPRIFGHETRAGGDPLSAIRSPQSAIV